MAKTEKLDNTASAQKGVADEIRDIVHKLNEKCKYAHDLGLQVNLEPMELQRVESQATQIITKVLIVKPI